MAELQLYCLLTPWKNPNIGLDRPIYICGIEDKEEYKEDLKSIKNACEYVGKSALCRVYLDWDKKVPKADCYDTPFYMEKYEMGSLKEQLENHFRKTPLLQNQKYMVLSRKPRLVKDDMVKFSYRIIFLDLITNDYKKIKTYLISCGLKDDEPWDLKVYNNNQIVNAVYSCKPDEPEYPLEPHYGTDKERPVKDMLITSCDDTISVIDWDKWIVAPPQPISQMEVVRKEIDKDEYDSDDISVDKVKTLLTCINPDCSYQEWLEILMAVKSALNDSDDAYVIADDWSKIGKSYDSRVFGRTWNGIRDLTKYTMGTLIYQAKKQNPEKFQTDFVKVFKPKYNFDDIYKLRNYKQIKKVFETRVAKIMDSVRFIYKCDDEPISIKNRKSLIETYENVLCEIEVDGKIRTKPFINMWLTDAKMRQYKSALNLPPPLICPNDVLNLWTPYKMSLKKGDIEKGEFKTIEDHIFLLCGKNEECAEHTIKTLAYKLQFPAYKTRIMMIFVGAEGTGKNLLYDVFKKLFGEDKCFSTPAVGRKVFGDFATSWADKQIVVLNDFNPAEIKKENSEKMKDFITETDVVLEKKYQDEVGGKQYAHFIAFSQSYTPVANNSGSRRFFQMECATDEIGNQEYFDKIIKWTENDDNIYAWFNHLMTMDLSGFNPSNFPITEVSQMAKMANASPIEAYMEDKKRDIVKLIQYKKIGENKYILKATKEEEGAFATLNHNSLFSSFKCWCCGNVPDYQTYTKRKFQLEMYRLRLKFGLEYHGDNKHPERTFWKIVKKGVYEMVEEENEEDEEENE